MAFFDPVDPSTESLLWPGCVGFCFVASWAVSSRLLLFQLVAPKENYRSEAASNATRPALRKSRSDGRPVELQFRLLLLEDLRDQLWRCRSACSGVATRVSALPLAPLVWALAEDRSVYVVEHADGARNSVVTIFLDDLDAHVAAIAARGLEPDERARASQRPWRSLL